MRLTFVLALAVVARLAVAADHAGNDVHLFQPDQVQWADGPKSLPPGAKAAVLLGDPTKEGPYVLRLKMPEGYKIPAHTHPKVEQLTVISGTLFLVMGDDLDPKTATKLPAGSFGAWPAGMKHLVWNEGETIVQVHGMGPFAIKYVNPADDPRNK